MIKAKGRSLSDFGKLLPAEEKVRVACAEGRRAEIGTETPLESSEANTVRASVLVFFAMGGDEQAPSHHLGVDVKGVWVVDVFDFQNADTLGNLHFLHCHFANQPLMQGCTVNGNLTIRKSSIPGISLDGARIRGFIGFDKCLSVGEVRLISATASGMMSFRGSKLDGDGRLALVFDRAKIGGSIFLDEGFTAKGGVKFLGARVDGNVALCGARLSAGTAEALHFDRAEIAGDVFLNRGFAAEGDVRFRSAKIGGGLSCNGGMFNRSKNEALFLDRADIGGDVLFKNIRTSGVVRMLGVQIGGDLECNGAKLDGNTAESLYLDGAKIEGSVRLTDNFSAVGLVKLLGIQLGGQLVCSGANLDGSGGAALSFSGANIAGSVFLNSGFVAIGGVQLSVATIGQALDCSQGKFVETLSEHSFSAEGATVAGAWLLVEMREPLCMATLAGFTVGTLVDDETAWGRDLVLDGFTFGNLGGPSRTDANWRIAWLRKQYVKHLGSAEFKPRPWLQVRDVLHGMGHWEGAREVAIALEEHRRDIGLIGETSSEWSKPRSALNRAVSTVLHAAFGKLIAYGYRPMRLVYWMLAVWLTCAFVFWSAALLGAMGPTNPLVFNDPKLSACRDNWYLCADLPEEYTGFSPLAYSLDVLLPLVNLEQEKDWGPLVPTPQAPWWKELGINWSLKHVTRLVLWAEILFGWVASLLLVAVFSGLTKRRED